MKILLLFSCRSLSHSLTIMLLSKYEKSSFCSSLPLSFQLYICKCLELTKISSFKTTYDVLCFASRHWGCMHSCTTSQGLLMALKRGLCLKDCKKRTWILSTLPPPPISPPISGVCGPHFTHFPMFKGLLKRVPSIDALLWECFRLVWSTQPGAE